MRHTLAGTFWLVLFLVAAPVAAQTGAPLLLKPWPATPEADPEGAAARVELSADGLLFSGAEIGDTGHELDLWQAESQGRYRLGPPSSSGQPLSLGYEALYLSLNADDAALPERLADVSAAFAVNHHASEDWALGFVGGVGYAGTAPFADGDSVYFLGDLILNRRLDERSRLSFILSYDGNRTLWPDTPLPAVAYSRRSSERLAYTVGLPYSSITWQPADRWLLELQYTLPYALDALVSYELAENLSLFGAFDNRYDAFWLEDDEDRRIFFTQRRLEAGFRYEATGSTQLVLAGGYAFGQEFETRWDSRDTEELREVDAAPYVRVGIDLAF